MKKFVKYMLVAAAALAAFACNKEAGIEIPASETNVVVFTATLDEAVKATLSEYKVCWEAGDEIAVYNGSEWATSAALTTDDIEADGRTATFAATIAAASSYTLVYPASAVSTASLPDGAAAGSVMLTLPDVQTIAPGKTVDPKALVQIGVSTDPTKVSFKNATSLVEFKAPESGIITVGLEAFSASESTIGIAGDAAVNPEPAATTGSIQKVLVKGDFVSGQNYFAVVWPQEAVGSILFCFDKGSAKAGRLGKSAAGFSLPVSGGRKFEDFGTISWIEKIMNKADLDRWVQISDFYGPSDTVELGADIDYEGATWYPLNANPNSGHFGGLFDGAGHSIYNIVIGATGDYCGFFSTIASEELMLRVKDLTFGRDSDGSRVEPGSAKLIGALVGRIKNSAISNVSNRIPITTETDGVSEIHIGGVAGRVMADCKAELLDCSNYAPIHISSDVAAVYGGGVIGLLSSPTLVKGCSNYGELVRDKAASGGKVNCYGGIAGRCGNNTEDIIMAECTNYGTVRMDVNVKASQMYIGGIIGMDGKYQENAPSSYCVLSLNECTNEGAVEIFNQSYSGDSKYIGIGGVMGYINGPTKMIGCVNKGAVTKLGNCSVQSCYGGILGYISVDTGIIEDCVNGAPDDDSKGVVSDLDQKNSQNIRMGGIIGFANKGTANHCINYGRVFSSSTVVETGYKPDKIYLGGIVGNNGIAKLNACESYGPVSVASDLGNTAAGGLIGLSNNSSACETCFDCIVKAEISCGVAGNTGAVIGRLGNSGTTSFGSQAQPIKIKSGTSINSAAVTSSNFESMLAGSSYGITASGVASGNNTIWATFQ